MRQQSAAPPKDYSGYFLVAILLGIVMVVLGLTMAAAQSGSRLKQTYKKPVAAAERQRAGQIVKFTMSTDRYMFWRMEPFRGG